MTYIWQRDDWPNLTWNNEIVEQDSNQFVTEANRLFEIVSALPEIEKTEVTIDLMVAEALNTSLIEGESFSRSDLRSSIRNQLKVNTEPEKVLDPKTNGIASVIVSVREHFKDSLTAQQLYAWQNNVIVNRYDRSRIESGNGGHIKNQC